LYTFQGDWQGKVTVTNVKTNKSYPLIDMTGTDKLKKHRIEKPMEQQTPLESQQVLVSRFPCPVGIDLQLTLGVVSTDGPRSTPPF
jgi:hypothetical protein